LVSYGVACLLALGLLFLGLPTAFPRLPHSGLLRVAVANLALDNRDPRAAAQVVRRFDADLLFALEWTGDNLDPRAIADPGRRVLIESPRLDAHGVLVVARGELETIGRLVPSPVTGPCAMPFATVRVRSDVGWISVIGVHVPPTMEECGDGNRETLASLGELVRDGVLRRDLGAARAGDPLILAGDFNATPDSIDIAPLRASMIDAQADRSWLPTGTWIPKEMALGYERIDYVWVGRAIGVVDAWTVALPGSDHRALIVDIDPAGAATR
jgi:hypothetical protein